jgi:hypothetical protein
MRGAAAARDRLSVPVLGDPRDGVYTVAGRLEAWVETRAAGALGAIRPAEAARVVSKECCVHAGCCRPSGGEEQAPAMGSTAKAKADAGFGECAVAGGRGVLLAILAQRPEVGVYGPWC